MNKIIIIGRLTKDPNLKYTCNNISLCTFTVAINRPKNSSGESLADFIPVVVWNKQVESCMKHLKKGSKVAICGSLQSKSYELDGIKRNIHEINAERVEFLEPLNFSNNSDTIEGFKEIEDYNLPF